VKPFLLFVLAAGMSHGTNCSGNLTDPSQMSVNARVAFVDVEGGCWVLVTESGKRYEPVKLASEFRKDGLKVAVRIVTRSDVGSYCMVGEVVEILAIEVR